MNIFRPGISKIAYLFVFLQPALHRRIYRAIQCHRQRINIRRLPTRKLRRQSLEFIILLAHRVNGCLDRGEDQSGFGNDFEPTKDARELAARFHDGALDAEGLRNCADIGNNILVEKVCN